jgi:FtsP/CotA-like multicopper oxidase with cupredoxin domain
MIDFRFRWRALLSPIAALALACAASIAGAQAPPPSAIQSKSEVCPRSPVGSVLSEPQDLRSAKGVLQVDFTYRNFLDDHGQMRYCYLYKDGSQAPNLRVQPGDWLVLRLKNELKPPPGSPRYDHAKTMAMTMPMADSCGGGKMDGWSTNLHFHGLTVPPVCHQDDVLKTLIPPGAPPFEYRFQIPSDEPPGLYWYHPHVHGFSNIQVQGGASGALIVEGIERANQLLAGMPERVLIIRDQPLLNPDASPSSDANIPQPPVMRDAEGDILNTGTGNGKPSRDLSVNFAPVPYPDYPPALIAMKPAERQLWRVLNASAITYLDLQILLGNAPQGMGVVSLDGVPINEGGMIQNRVIWESHVLVPPGGRIDFVYNAPPEGKQATLVTRAVDTGPAGENDPLRPLITIVARANAAEPQSALPSVPGVAAPQTSAWLGVVKPVRERKLYFSEKPSDPNDPNSPTVFMLTVDGQPPVPYDPQSAMPNIVAQQGDVEDWIIENRSRELHAFHIHQLHFLLKEYNGVPVDEPFLRDTVNVAYWDGVSRVYPSVKLRMDFRDPNAVGTFVYHCHLLEHEDGGMMGTIRVEPRAQAKSQPSAAARLAPSTRVLQAKDHEPFPPDMLR